MQHVELLNDSTNYTRKINNLVSAIYDLNNQLASDEISNDQFIEKFKSLQSEIRATEV